MRFTEISIFILALVGGSLFCHDATAQYPVRSSEFGSGGGVVNGGNYRMVATVGQLLIGGVGRLTHTNAIGFWYQSVGLTIRVAQTSNNLLIEYWLEQNYPNPFNPSTVIKFGIPERRNVLIKIYDILGSEVTTLLNQESEAGWYNLEFNADGYSSGIYFCIMQVYPGNGGTGSYISTKKMMLIK